LFQSTHPRGVRLPVSAPAGPGRSVSIHAPTWGATQSFLVQDLMQVFQSTHPRGVRQGIYADFIAWEMFQSTHPRGVRHTHIATRWLAYRFNPRTHVGCDLFQFIGCLGNDVSIHAPTWGATSALVFALYRQRVSIHAPTWGATHSRGVQLHFMGVSIHAPTWGATLFFVYSLPLLTVSIHAPTWGATYQQSGHGGLGGSFNPRTHVGCDDFDQAAFRRFKMFQSTHPRGVRRMKRTQRLRQRSFNPRTHVGCDYLPTYLSYTENVSIHAPTWGATRQGIANRIGEQCFNPRTHVGCDFGSGVFFRHQHLFQSTHPRGVRPG